MFDGLCLLLFSMTIIIIMKTIKLLRKIVYTEMNYPLLIIFNVKWNTGDQNRYRMTKSRCKVDCAINDLHENYIL